MMFLEGFVIGVVFFLTPGGRCGETEVIAEAGSKAVLPCKCGIKQCDPAAITWRKSNKSTVWRRQTNGLQYWGSNWVESGIQRVRCPHSVFVHGDYGLQINSVKVEDGGVYSCMVVVGRHVTRHQVLLRVIQVSITPPSPIWGQPALVACSVTPSPDGASVKWMVNNRPLGSQPRSSFSKPGSVVIEKATENVAGNWTCVFSHKKEGRATAVLSVRGIEQPPKDDTKVYAAVGSPVTLPCVFSPGLNPTFIVFEKTDVGEKPAFSKLLRAPSDRSVQIQEVASGDEGKYRCAGNVQGRRITRTMQLVVAKIVQSSKKGSVALTCKLSDASEAVNYKWVHTTYDLNGTKSEGPDLTGPTIYPEHGGQWTCRYYGKDGFLGNVTTQVMTQMMSSQSGQKPGASRNKAVVIGLSVLLVVLLLILAQAYKNHQRRKRIFQYPAMETIVHTISNEREEKEKSRVKE